MQSSSASCLPYEVEASERKALEEFRQSLGKARYAAELEVSPRLSKIFNPQELRLLQTKPIPRIKWTRKTRDPRTGNRIFSIKLVSPQKSSFLSGGVKSEKVIYIYGGENIRLFYEWRRRRVARKQYLDASITAAQAQVGTASRTCRRCGQVGHISSNPVPFPADFSATTITFHFDALNCSRIITSLLWVFYRFALSILGRGKRGPQQHNLEHITRQ